jgi:hypothetical protein
LGYEFNIRGSKSLSKNKFKLQNFNKSANNRFSSESCKFPPPSIQSNSIINTNQGDIINCNNQVKKIFSGHKGPHTKKVQEGMITLIEKPSKSRNPDDLSSNSLNKVLVPDIKMKGKFDKYLIYPTNYIQKTREFL